MTPGTRKMTRLLTYIICLTTSVNALADAKFVLIGEDLKHNRVTLNTLRDDDLSYFDAERRLVNASITKFLQIRSSSVRLKSIARNAVVIDTVNAQRFVGDWVGTDDEGQILKITLRRSGRTGN